MFRFLIKIDRLSAWTLFISMLLYFISGFGMTKGLISPAYAVKLHLSYLTYVVMIAFSIHTSYAIHLAFKRWQIWNVLTKVLLILFFLTFLGSFVYIDRYYKKAPLNNNSVTTLNSFSEIDDDSPSNANSGTTNFKTFTLTELAKYNGQNGMPAYVAVDNSVYDLSTIFQAGTHFSHFAGTELTNAFYSYHAKQVLSKYPIVGTLVK